MEDSLLNDESHNSIAKEDTLTEAKGSCTEEKSGTEVDDGLEQDFGGEKPVKDDNTEEDVNKKESYRDELMDDGEEKDDVEDAPERTVSSEAGPAADVETAEIEDEEYHNSTMSALSEGRWDEMYQRLLKFKELHGHCLVPNRYREDLQLGAWVAGQRKNYKLLVSGSGKQTTMTMERAQMLVDNGFEWTAKNPRHLMWEVRFAELKDFQSQYGHAQVPIGWEQNVQLANWVSTQDYKNLIRGKTSRLNNERVKRLSGLGFAWELQRGGRRRRLSVSPATKGEDRTKRSHPADADTEVATVKKTKVVDYSDGFAIDDGTAPVVSSTGRRRTTLKKKLANADEGPRCILPGVTIMGGGRDAPSSTRLQKRGGGTDSSGAESRSQLSPMQNNHPMIQQQPTSMVGNFQNNEALIRAFGNGAGAPWQVLPNGSYQFVNPLAQQFAAGGGVPGNPFFPMAAGPYGMMNSFPGVAGGLHRGMETTHFDQNMNPQEMEFRLRQQQQASFGGSGRGGIMGSTSMQPFQAASSAEFNNSDVNQQRQQNGMNPHFFAAGGNALHQGVPMAGQGGSLWGASDATAATAQASQQTHGGSALMGGIDERSLPPHLASMARRMNNSNAMSMGAGDMTHGMHHNHARRGDPPADPPSMGGNRSPHHMANNPSCGGSGMGMRQDVFADADE